ncbi:hypothetical protein RF11_14872 [Thelohanellus kitauei]|uniref:Uncharacterized protein n=1 Tax=Thelohanellus kitauei TaxID=669202 RepID=A0A0C2NLF2_THEKT|nr:hypothetical protein RF11_14872 [Thelohanellus kitauei]
MTDAKSCYCFFDISLCCVDFLQLFPKLWDSYYGQFEDQLDKLIELSNLVTHLHLYAPNYPEKDEQLDILKNSTQVVLKLFKKNPIEGRQCTEFKSHNVLADIPSITLIAIATFTGSQKNDSVCLRTGI